MLLLAQSLTDERTWPLLGMGAVALAYIVLRPMFKRKRDPLERAPTVSSAAQQQALERTMQALLVDLTEMARQISAQLDTRAARLDALIREADQKIAELRCTAADGSPARPLERREASSALMSAPRLSLPSEQSLFPPPAAEPADPQDSRHAQVYELADAGRGPGEIAAELHRPRGEIELILALRSRS